APSERLCSARQRLLVETAPRRLVLAFCEHVAGAVLEALAVLEKLELSRCRNLDIGIGPDAEAAACGEIIDALENAVAEIGLGDRAQARHRATIGDTLDLPRIEMRGMDQAPALVHRRMIEQPHDRAPARPGEAILDLLHLFGDV